MHANFRAQLPPEIILLIKHRRNLRRKLYNFKTSDLKGEFNRFSKLVKRRIEQFRSASWQNFLNKIIKSPTSTKLFWKRINRFRRNPEANTLPIIKEYGKQYSTNSEKAHCFADNLQITFSSATNQQFNAKWKNKVDHEVEEFLSRPYAVDPVKPSELNAALLSINRKTKSDVHGLCNLILHKIPNVFKHHNLTLFNLCLELKRLPLAWRVSTITMLRKKADCYHLTKSFRPISSTSCLCKLHESIIQSKLSSFLESNNLLKRVQSGFRKKRQTRDNIFLVTQKTLETLNTNKKENSETFAKRKNKKKKKVAMILFDIAAAFEGMAYLINLQNGPIIHHSLDLPIFEHFVLRSDKLFLLFAQSSAVSLRVQ